MINSIKLNSCILVIILTTFNVVTCFKSFIPLKNNNIHAPITKTSIQSQAETEIAQTSNTIEEKLFENFITLLQKKQQEIINILENLEVDNNCNTAKFSCDEWGGMINNTEYTIPLTTSGGRTRVIQNGTIIEKGAVSITCIKNGILSSERAKSIQDKSIENESNIFDIKEGDSYSAAALSLVLHSRSPMIPTFRSDVRLFLVKSKENKKIVAWFGGGADLTPYYLFENDVSNFHKQYCNLCMEYDMNYDNMKKYCDDYFFLPARDEHRGTGGIFFDNLLSTTDNNSYNFVHELINLWMPSWVPIINKRKDIVYTDDEKYWQMIRRGRYLEFNLLYDRGVKFGLVGKNPRVEGVMVSAPPLIAWEYNYNIEKGSREEKMMNVLKSPIDWIDFESKD